MHLSTMEKFMLMEDQPGCPMTFVIDLTLRGQVDRSAFEGALRMTLPFQPLLAANIGRGKGNRMCWIAAEEPIPVCDWGTSDDPVVCPDGHERIDLTRETGLRVWVRQGAERAVITMQFHHACTDGIGAYRFIGEVLAAYGILQEGPERYALCEMDQSLLRDRHQRSLGRKVPFGLETAVRAMRYAFNLFWRMSAPLAVSRPSQKEALPEAAFPGYCTFSFDRASHQKLRDVASQKGVMLNDILLRDMFLTLARWQKLHSRWLKFPRLRIMMPTDLRETEDIPMPAANMVGYAFITRTANECSAPGTLLDGIKDETKRIKHQRLGSNFLETLVASDYVPGLLRFIITNRWSLCTAVLSNVADPSRRFTSKLPRKGGLVQAGNLLLEDITGVPPYRPRTRATVSIFQYDRRLTLCVRFDPKQHTRKDSEQLLSFLVEQLRKSAEEWEPESMSRSEQE